MFVQVKLYRVITAGSALMDEFIDSSSLDSLRVIHESEEQWRMRRMFIERHVADYPKNRLLCLAQIYCNMNLLGCT